MRLVPFSCVLSGIAVALFFVLVCCNESDSPWPALAPLRVAVVASSAAAGLVGLVALVILDVRGRSQAALTVGGLAGIAGFRRSPLPYISYSPPTDEACRVQAQYPTGPTGDPHGTHGTIWGELAGEDYAPPADADRTLAAYSAGAAEDRLRRAGRRRPDIAGHAALPDPGRGVHRSATGSDVPGRVRAGAAVLPRHSRRRRSPLTSARPAGMALACADRGGVRRGVEQCHGNYCWRRSSGLAAG